jgi:hypothetical protein
MSTQTEYGEPQAKGLQGCIAWSKLSLTDLAVNGIDSVCQPGTNLKRTLFAVKVNIWAIEQSSITQQQHPAQAPCTCTGQGLAHPSLARRAISAQPEGA